MDKVDKLVEKYYGAQETKFNLESLCELVSKALVSHESQSLTERKKKEPRRGRFSYKIDIPVLTPSEAWGDPGSQSREHILELFRAITGGRDIAKRIESINGFLDPSSAERKIAPGRMISMMMIIEALQATLNDYNESAAGFVFEGFMAALTGGHQVAGKVAGTLPIEDFMAFSEYGGASTPVSLKLLGAKTPVKGSFTNIVDFLLLRGAESIKYIVAYKLTTGEVVQKLNIFDFNISVDNFILFIAKTSGGDKLLSGVTDDGEDITADMLQQDFLAFAKNQNNLLPLAKKIIRIGGYQAGGLLHKWVKTVSTECKENEHCGPGEICVDGACVPAPGTPGGRELTRKEKEQAKVDRATAEKAAAEKAYARTKTQGRVKDLGDLRGQGLMAESLSRQSLREGLDRGIVKASTLNEALDRGIINPIEAFHYIEKLTILEEAKGSEKGEKSQWSASFPQLQALRSTIDLTNYGELNLSQDRIEELIEIYSKKIGDTIGVLLTAVKSMSENVTEYYVAQDRSKGAAAGKEAQGDAGTIKSELEEDPLGREDK